jgi:hypothetical protein
MNYLNLLLFLLLHRTLFVKCGQTSVYLFSSFYPYLLRGVGTIGFSSYCDKDSAIIFRTGHLPHINPP